MSDWLAAGTLGNGERWGPGDGQGSGDGAEYGDTVLGVRIHLGQGIAERWQVTVWCVRELRYQMLRSLY